MSLKNLNKDLSCLVKEKTRGQTTLSSTITQVEQHSHSIPKERKYHRNPVLSKQRVIRFIDLFAGMGGTRIGFEQACKKLGVATQCVLTSEIKPTAMEVYQSNFPGAVISGDITQIPAKAIPDFDYLLAGFPCQPFSFAGKRKGAKDKRGQLFYEITRILKVKRPEGFILENVEGLEKFDKGELLKSMISMLRRLGYKVATQVLDSADFGVPQTRRRIYITGNKKKKIFLELNKLTSAHSISAGMVLQNGLPVMKTNFTKKLLRGRNPQDLEGMSIKDKRGGKNNLHSWDIALKGRVSTVQKRLMNELMTKRRSKKWAEAKGIDWMDGMPLTTEEISTFFNAPHLQSLLDDLCAKGYLKLEHPRKIVIKDGVQMRAPDETIPKGYNIVVGKLSFEINKILDRRKPAPTLVAMDMERIAVTDKDGVRRLTSEEALALSGFPTEYRIPESIRYKDFCDLIGNAIVPPVVAALTEEILTI